MKSEARSRRQAFVTWCFRKCMSVDIRSVPEIRRFIRDAIPKAQGADIREWRPTDYQLQIMISRCTFGRVVPGRLELEFVPAFSRPPRYVSLARYAALMAEYPGCPEARAQASDLKSAREVFRRRAAREARKVTTLDNALRNEP